jgi:hypothetical protein
MNLPYALIMAGMLVSGSTVADQKDDDDGKDRKTHTYAVTITNITAGQSFTPLLVATHSDDVSFFELGEMPSADLADLAEGGKTMGLQMTLDSMPEYVRDTATSDTGLIGPGEDVTVYVIADRDYNRLSLAGMLLPTNDTFVAINSMRLSKKNSAGMALAYDAGSEMNDELCINIPGPQCGGAGVPFSTGLAEGYVHISRGISGEGDLLASDYDWRNPVARVTVVRMD